MSVSENLLKQADYYLDKKLSESEKDAFELELSSNKALQEYVAINKEMKVQFSEKDWQFTGAINSEKTKELQDYFKSDDAVKLKTAINNASSNYHKKVKPSGINNIKLYSVLAIAASIVLLIGLFFFSSDQDFYNDYNSWNELPSLIERGEVQSNVLQDAENAFLTNDYLLANTLYDKYLKETESINTTVYLYFGITQLELNQNEKALSTFNTIIESDSIDFSKGYWYKTLVYLKTKDINNAIKQLELIVKDPENYKYTEAKRMLDKLKS